MVANALITKFRVTYRVPKLLIVQIDDVEEIKANKACGKRERGGFAHNKSMVKLSSI